MSVLTKADVKPYLNMNQTENDSLVEDVIGEAEAWVAERCGPLSAVSKTEQVRRFGDALVLNYPPVISVTSVTATESGATVTVESDDIDLAAGVIELECPTEDVYTVVYSAGRTTLPADLRRAVIEMCRYLWRPVRGSGARGGDPDQMASLRLAETLIADYRPF